MKQSLSLVTLGVADHARAKAFYEALGWSVAMDVEETVFFELNGVVLVLWSREKLAADLGIEDDGARWGGVALAHNVGSDAEVDRVVAEARANGAEITRAPGADVLRRLCRRLPRPRRACVGGRAQPGVRARRRRLGDPARRLRRVRGAPQKSIRQTARRSVGRVTSAKPARANMPTVPTCSSSRIALVVTIG